MSRRVTTRMVRTGARAITYSAGEGYDFVPHNGEPNIWAHVYRRGPRVHWWLTIDREGVGDLLAKGTSWTEQGGFLRASARAHGDFVWGAACRSARAGRGAR